MMNKILHKIFWYIFEAFLGEMTNFNFLTSTPQINSQHQIPVFYHNSLFNANNEAPNNNFFQSYSSHIINSNIATTSSMPSSTSNNTRLDIVRLPSPQLKGMDRKVNFL